MPAAVVFPLAPILAALLVEDEIVSHVDVLGHRVEHPVHLGACLVANEDHGNRAIVQLGLVRLRLLHGRQAPKCAKEAHRAASCHARPHTVSCRRAPWWECVSGGRRPW
uniref:Secreted protein n=1 Tax=Arundo donax TaxID=35708 RepID=A0A0A8Z1A1_ARUDO